MSLLIIGNTVIDLIFPEVKRLACWPQHTEFTKDNLVLLKTSPIITVGGNGANAAYVAARCGAEVKLHSNIGDDAFGTIARDWLEEAGCEVAAGPPALRTATNVTIANPNLQRATYFYPGATPQLPSPSVNATSVLIAGWPHPAIRLSAQRLKLWRSRGIRTALDVGPFIKTTPSLKSLAPQLDHLDLLITNDHELLELTECLNIRTAMTTLRQSFAADVVVKRGADGVSWYPHSSAQARHTTGLKIKAVNTVGAGDTFNGALLTALDRGERMTSALQIANTTAASVVGSTRGVLGVRIPK